MTNSGKNPFTPEGIYEKYLSTINGIKFTPREIDVAVCLTRGKSSKATADFLSVGGKSMGTKSVETHILNIGRKIGGGARNSIIAFMEKSDRYPVMGEYYSALLIERELASMVNKAKPTASSAPVLLLGSGGEKPEDPLARFMESRLTSFGVKVFVRGPKAFLEEYQTSIKPVVIYPIFSERGDSPDPEISFPCDPAPYPADGDPYLLLCEILSKLFHSPEFEKTKKSFLEKYDPLRKNRYSPLQKTNVTGTNFFRADKRIFKKYFLFPAIIITLILIFAFFYNLPLASVREETEVSNVLSSYFKDFSVDNMTIERSDKNYSATKKLDAVTNLILSGRIEKYFNPLALDSVSFLNCVYNLNALANYRLMKMHETESARKILEYAKIAEESYARSRSGSKISFEKLSPSEILMELSVIDSLPELYAISCYSLGRVTIYENDPGRGYKDFVLAKFLGEKTGIFEGFLSVRSGILAVRGSEIHELLKRKEYSQAANLIKESVELYEGLMKDGGKYKIRFRPGRKEKQEFIVPKDDMVNVADCARRSIRLYTKLIILGEEVDPIIKKISEFYIDASSERGLLDPYWARKYETTNMVADFYNSLGYFLLALYDRKIDFTDFGQKLSKQLELAPEKALGKELGIIYKLFETGKDLSRYAEFPKADACDGLAEVLERRLNQKGVPESEKNALSQKITELKADGKAVNRLLKRTPLR